MWNGLNVRGKYTWSLADWILENDELRCGVLVHISYCIHCTVQHTLENIITYVNRVLITWAGPRIKRRYVSSFVYFEERPLPFAKIEYPNMQFVSVEY